MAISCSPQCPSPFSIFHFPVCSLQFFGPSCTLAASFHSSNPNPRTVCDFNLFLHFLPELRHIGHLRPTTCAMCIYVSAPRWVPNSWGASPPSSQPVFMCLYFFAPSRLAFVWSAGCHSDRITGIRLSRRLQFRFMLRGMCHKSKRMTNNPEAFIATVISLAAVCMKCVFNIDLTGQLAVLFTRKNNMDSREGRTSCWLGNFEGFCVWDHFMGNKPKITKMTHKDNRKYILLILLSFFA